MLSEGFVLKIEGEYATVGVKRQTACDTCRANCGGHCDKASTVETVVKNTLGAKVGDRVTLYSKTSTVMGFAVTVFLLPLIFAVLGYAVSYLLGGSTAVNAVATVFAFILTYFVIWLVYGKRKSYETIIMHEIVRK